LCNISTLFHTNLWNFINTRLLIIILFRIDLCSILFIFVLCSILLALLLIIYCLMWKYSVRKKKASVATGSVMSSMPVVTFNRCQVGSIIVATGTNDIIEPVATEGHSGNERLTSPHLLLLRITSFAWNQTLVPPRLLYFMLTIL
jgi:hypothetical protein